MILVTNREAAILREQGYGKFLAVVNKGHRSKQKKHYVKEDMKVIGYMASHPELFGGAYGRD